MAVFERLHPSIGAEVAGIDPTAPLPSAAVAALVEALPMYGVLVFRALDLPGDRQVELGRAFGELEILPEPEKRNSEFPEIFDLTNVRPDGTIVDFDEPQAVFLRGTQRWHTDSSFRAVPCLATMLYAVEAPPSGSTTLYADMYAAYEALDPERREALDGLQLVHSYEHSRANNPGELEPMDDQERAKFPPVTHPLVRTHEDGRRSLYMGAHASHVDGMDVADGRALLEELHSHATEERFVYAHHWETGDLVIWDNRCTLHRLLPYDIAGERRVMRRITVAGSGPVT